MLRLRVKAPFAAFRRFAAGSFRPSEPFIPPSTAYGLVLGIAGIETRFDDGESDMTLMRGAPELPAVELALGAVQFPEAQSIFQQLHNYPVGSSGKEHAADCKGAKYNIQPIRREFLAGIDAYVCLRGNDELVAAVRHGLREGARLSCAGRPRYGVPFLGDNQFLIDVLCEESEPQVPAYWFRRLGGAESEGSPRRCRLTVWIDRADMSRTATAAYAPTAEPAFAPPADAWTRIEPPAAAPPGPNACGGGH